MGRKNFVIYVGMGWSCEASNSIFEGHEVMTSRASSSLRF